MDWSPTKEQTWHMMHTGQWHWCQQGSRQ